MKQEAYFEKYTEDIQSALSRTVTTDACGQTMDLFKGFEIWAKRAKTIQDTQEGLLFFCGNGASATMAEHMSHDWFQNAQVNTYSVSETAHLTAISNDLSYEDVFSFRIGRVCSARDILVTISSSGNSANVVKAVRAAKEKGSFVITLSGMDAENLSRLSGDLNFYVPLKTYGMTESAHAVLLHAALDYFLDQYMGGRH